MKGLFFNSLPDDTNPTGYDRPFNADDISDFLTACWDTGVCKTDTVNGEPQGLKVLAISGMTVSVNVGRCAINGKLGINRAAETFTISPNGTNATRYDYIVARFDNNVSVRDIYLELVTGDSAKPTAADLAQNRGVNKVYELVLAYIAVAPSATVITQSNITDTRGNKDLCPWFTPVKGYDDYYDAVMQTHESTVTLISITNTVITDLPSKLYNERYSLISVYTNGIKEAKTAFIASVSGGYVVITFTAQKAAGSKITVIMDNFIDGEGMGTVLAQYTQLLQDVADLKAFSEYNYICNGVNDNIVISRIVETFGNDTTISVDKQFKLNVYGNFGCTTHYAGAGTSVNNYKWFELGTPKKKVVVDFTNCSKVNIPLVANTHNIIFNGPNIHIIGINLQANCTGAGCNVLMFSTTTSFLTVENCYLESIVTEQVLMSKTGTFINCEAYISSANNHAYCFQIDNIAKPIIVLGGNYRAYTATQDTSIISAVVYAAAGATNGVCVLNGVNCPTVERSNFYQKNCLRINSGYLTSNGLITALPNATASTATATLTGTIPVSKT